MISDQTHAAPRYDTSGVGLALADLPPLTDDARPDPARFDPRAWFANPAAPLEIEIGSGKGTFLVQQAALQPGTNFLGIEWEREFWRHAADRIRRRGLPNVRLLHADAVEFLRCRAPDECASVIHLYFPDPWPKRRHHKRRTISDEFLREARRALVPGGELRIVTDHDEYWVWMEDHFARWASPETGDEQSRDRKIAGAPSPAPAQRSGQSHDGADQSRDREGAVSPPFALASSTTPQFQRLPFERPESAGEGEVVGTNFERKYRREGRPFHATILRRPGPC